MGKSKKIIIVLIAIILVCVSVMTIMFVSNCTKNNQEKTDENTSEISSSEEEGPKELTGPISDYVECVVDVDCDVEERRGFAGNYWYVGTGTITVNMSKFSTKNLIFDYVRVTLVISLSNYEEWEFLNYSGKKMTKTVTLSSGGSAKFTTDIKINYQSSAYFSELSNIKDPFVYAYIIKDSGKILES